MTLPFLQRGSVEWDRRENVRRSNGCCCLSYGSVEQALRAESRGRGETPDIVARCITNARRIPPPERLRELRQAQAERLELTEAGYAAVLGVQTSRIATRPVLKLMLSNTP